MSVLNFVSSRLLVSILFSSFSGVFVLSFGTCFFVSSFCLSTYVCFYLLGRTAMSLGLGRVPLCSRCPVGSSGIAYLIIQSRCFRCASPCAPSSCSWNLIAIGTSMVGIYTWLIVCEDLPWPLWWICCARHNPTEQYLVQQGSGACWVCPFSVSLMKVVGLCSSMVWSYSLGSEDSWEVPAKISCCLCPARATWCELQNDLKMAATSAGLVAQGEAKQQSKVGSL